MLSMHSFAAGLEVDTRWLFSNAELSRINWRRGSHDGELIVEVDTVEMSDQEKVLDIGPRRMGGDTHTWKANSSNPPRVYTTVVGQYDDLASGRTKR